MGLNLFDPPNPLDPRSIAGCLLLWFKDSSESGGVMPHKMGWMHQEGEIFCQLKTRQVTEDLAGLGTVESLLTSD